MVDIAVKRDAAWTCPAQGHQLADVLFVVHIREDEQISQLEADETNSGPVLLEQTEDGSACVLTLHCTLQPSAAISRLLVVSEARTLEAYNQMGEYCGTIRGERDDSVQTDSSDRGPFYKKQLVLEHPTSACDVKLLSLGGRSSILVHRVIVGLRPLQPGPAHGPGIDMQQVQCLVEEMGASLSPGAQNLMDMVHFQQQNQTGSLGGFLPLLMGGGVFSALAPGANICPAAVQQQQAAGSRDGSSPDPPASEANGNMSSESGGPVSHAQLAHMMSHFLNGPGPGEAPSGPELLPVLQSLCGQVTQLRRDDAAALAEKERELDATMERRLEEMERRLKEQMDRRLDALEQKLEKLLLSVLPHAVLSQGDAAEGEATGGDAVGGAAAGGDTVGGDAA